MLIGETTNDQAAGTTEQEAAKLVTNWLLGSTNLCSDAAGVNIELRVEREAEAGHYVFTTLYFGENLVAVIHVVFMDQASLLENWPSPITQVADSTSGLSSEPLQQLPINHRKHDKEVSAEFANPLSAAAVQFAKQVEAPDADPVLANAKSLASLPSASAWCAVLRGAEIIAGTHLTYRELWALASHSLIGPCTASGLTRLGDWVRMRLDEFLRNDGLSSWNAIVSLSSLRTHMLLYDAGRSDATRCPSTQFEWPKHIE